MRYVDFYAEIMGVQHNRKKFHIHHINGERGDNSISNLVLLPEKLHRRYHCALSKVMSYEYMGRGIFDVSGSFENYKTNGLREALENLLDIMEECSKWVDYRECVLNGVPGVNRDIVK